MLASKTKPNHNCARAASGDALLLPLPRAEARQRSLVAHLALAVCRDGKGNKHQLSELARMVYLSFFMWQKGLGLANDELFRDAERVLEHTAQYADATGEWLLDSPQLVEEVAQLYDVQLDAIAKGTLLDCEIEFVRTLDRVAVRNAEHPASVAGS